MSTTQEIVEAVEDRANRQVDIAELYKSGLMSDSPPDWIVVNVAIMERWSLGGLTRIKKIAWRREATDD